MARQGAVTMKKGAAMKLVKLPDGKVVVFGTHIHMRQVLRNFREEQWKLKAESVRETDPAHNNTKGNTIWQQFTRQFSNS
jgi:hypothetical protein